MLVLKTADRNEILFSVPHCNYPFNQTYDDYSNELIRWVKNFKKEKISDPIIQKRASHVISENERVLKSIEYMRKKNIENLAI